MGKKSKALNFNTEAKLKKNPMAGKAFGVPNDNAGVKSVDMGDRRIIYRESLDVLKEALLQEKQQAETRTRQNALSYAQHPPTHTPARSKLEAHFGSAISKPVKLSKAESMMQKMGWNGGALGKDGKGIMEPIVPNMEYALKTKGFGLSRPEKKPRTPARPRAPPVGRAARREAKDTFRLNVLWTILDFVKNDDEVEILFDCKLHQGQRKIVHKLVEAARSGQPPEGAGRVKLLLTLAAAIGAASRHRIATHSEGQPPNRYLALYKEAPSYMLLVTPLELRGEPKKVREPYVPLPMRMKKKERMQLKRQMKLKQKLEQEKLEESKWEEATTSDEDFDSKNDEVIVIDSDDDIMSVGDDGLDSSKVSTENVAEIIDCDDINDSGRNRDGIDNSNREKGVNSCKSVTIENVPEIIDSHDEIKEISYKNGSEIVDTHDEIKDNVIDKGVDPGESLNTENVTEIIDNHDGTNSDSVKDENVDSCKSQGTENGEKVAKIIDKTYDITKDGAGENKYLEIICDFNKDANKNNSDENANKALKSPDGICTVIEPDKNAVETNIIENITETKPVPNALETNKSTEKIKNTNMVLESDIVNEIQGISKRLSDSKGLDLIGNVTEGHNNNESGFVEECMDIDLTNEDTFEDITDDTFDAGTVEKRKGVDIDTISERDKKVKKSANVVNDDSKCSLSKKDFARKNIRDLFAEFCKNDQYTEFRILGRFENEEIEVLDEFMNAVSDHLRGRCVNDVIVKLIQESRCTFSIRNDSGGKGRSFIMKTKVEPKKEDNDFILAEEY